MFVYIYKCLQKFAGLNVTGIIDKETMNKMERYRCGREDGPVWIPKSKKKFNQS